MKLNNGITLGIGGMVGGGIFLLNGVAVYKNRGYAPFSWLIGMCVCLLIVFSYCILTDEYPSKGGTIDYPEELIIEGKNWKKKIFTILVILGYIVLTSVYSLALANYLSNYYRIPKWTIFIAIMVIFFCLLINYFPQKIFNEILNILVYGKLVIFLMIIILGLVIKGKTEPKLKPVKGNLVETITFFSIVLFGLSSFLSYEGFEMVSNLSSDMENRKINIPRSFLISVITVGLVYSSISYVTNKHIGGMLTKKNMFSSLHHLVKQYGLGNIGFIIVIILSLMANLSAINATFYTNDDIWKTFLENDPFSNFLQKEIPLPFFKEKRKIYLWLSCLVSCLFLFLPQLVVANLGSLLFIIIFTVVSYLSILLIHKKDRDKKDINFFGKPFPKKPAKIICYSGLLVCIISIVLLIFSIIKEYQKN